MNRKTTGLYNKFRIERTDGKSAPGEKHSGCDYFVLDITHDEHAKAALLAYADSCAADYPALAADLRDKARYVGLSMILPVRPHGERLTEIRERVETATEGPWHTTPLYESGDGSTRAHEDDDHGIAGPEHDNPSIAQMLWAHDAAFVAHAREDVPWLIDQLQATLLRAEQAEQRIGSLKSTMSRSIDASCDGVLEMVRLQQEVATLKAQLTQAEQARDAANEECRRRAIEQGKLRDRLENATQAREEPTP